MNSSVASKHRVVRKEELKIPPIINQSIDDSPQAYTSKIVDTILAKMPSKFINVSPQKQISQVSSKQSLGAICKMTNLKNQSKDSYSLRRQSQFKSSRMHQEQIITRQTAQQDFLSQNSLQSVNNNTSLDKLKHHQYFNMGKKQKHLTDGSSPLTLSMKLNQIQQAQDNVWNHEKNSKKLTSFKKGNNKKLKLNNFSNCNMSIDERSSDIIEEQSESINEGLTPYKTQSSFLHFPQQFIYKKGGPLIIKNKHFPQNPELSERRFQQKFGERNEKRQLEKMKSHIQSNVYKDEMIKTNSNHELPLLSSSSFQQRFTHNHSINQGVNGSFGGSLSFGNSSASSRTQLALLVTTGDAKVQNHKLDFTKVSKQPAFYKHTLQCDTQTSTLQKQATQQSTKSLRNSNPSVCEHSIKIRVNKEEVDLKSLSTEHRSNMSLLYYDFNNSKYRLQSKQKQTLADLIIPEEVEEVLGQQPHSLEPPARGQVEAINEKIQKAKQKINFVNSSQQHPLQGKKDGGVELVRMGSPFFGVQSFTNFHSPTSSKQALHDKQPSKMSQQRTLSFGGEAVGWQGKRQEVETYSNETFCDYNEKD